MSDEFCDALTMATRRLSKSHVNPASISPLLANRLFAIEKAQELERFDRRAHETEYREDHHAKVEKSTR